MLFNKKASLEISIQAIVIIVLAMTILGLGLGFVRNLFGGIVQTTERVSEQVRQQLTDQLITSDRKIAFPNTEVVVATGGSEILPIGIRNKNSQTLDYTMDFLARSGPVQGSSVIQEFTNDAELDNWFQYTRQTNPFSLAPSETRIVVVRINVPSGTQSGSYLVTFKITNAADSSTYDEKDFFIVVRG